MLSGVELCHVYPWSFDIHAMCDIAWDRNKVFFRYWFNGDDRPYSVSSSIPGMGMDGLRRIGWMMETVVEGLIL